MLELLIIFFVALALYFDLKSRTLPDELNFFFTFLAISLVILQYEFDVYFLVSAYLPFFIFNMAFAYLLYKVGVWAGGDVKFFTALMAAMPLYSAYKPYAALSVFLTSAALLLPITFIYYVKEILLFKGELHKIFVESIIGAGRNAVVSFSIIFLIGRIYDLSSSYLLVIAIIILSFFIRIPFKIALPLFLVGFIFFRLNDFLALLLFLFFAALFLHFMRAAFHLVSDKVLTKEVSVKHLREGEIPAQTYYVSDGRLRVWSPGDAWRNVLGILKAGGRLKFSNALGMLKPKGRMVVDALKARGVLPEEIKELKRLGVKQILVKESLPFAPVVAAAFLVYKYWDALSLIGMK